MSIITPFLLLVTFSCPSGFLQERPQEDRVLIKAAEFFRTQEPQAEKRYLRFGEGTAGERKHSVSSVTNIPIFPDSNFLECPEDFKEACKLKSGVDLMIVFPWEPELKDGQAEVTAEIYLRTEEGLVAKEVKLRLFLEEGRWTDPEVVKITYY